MVASAYARLCPTPPQQLGCLVENRTAFTLDEAELSVFETLEPAEAVAFQFGRPMVAMMLSGRKVLHWPEQPTFAFGPGVVFVPPVAEPIGVDLPEASFENPTRCAVLDMSEQHIQKTVALLNERCPRTEPTDEWVLDLAASRYFVTDDAPTRQTLGRLLDIIMENNRAQAFFVTGALQELVVRLLQTQARRLLLDNSQQHATHRLSHVAEYIKRHLSEPLTIDQLAGQACMSKPHFFRCFKSEFGLTALEYIQQERIKTVKHLLSDPRHTLTEICFQAGFQDMSHFIRIVKKLTGHTPGELKRLLAGAAG
ncbi:AraC family transcriptional regulator [Hymenobacter daeguensis]